jgi:hypothetical protein
MYKTLCVAVLLLPTFALAQGGKSATPPFPSPLIVAKGKLVNQTAPIPTTTIFTPIQTGFYRLSVYATVTKTDPSSQSYWNFNMGWTDDAKAVAVNNILYTTGNVSGPFSYPNLGTIGGTSAPFEAKAGTPVTYSVTQDNGPDSSAYSLYYTLERLE